MVLLDSLTRANSESSPYPLTGHTGEGGAYTLTGGTDQGRIIANGQLVGTDGTSNSFYISAYSTVTNQRASVTFTTPSASPTSYASAGVCTRFSTSSAQGYSGRIACSPSGFAAQIIRWNNGTPSFTNIGGNPNVTGIAFNTQYTLSFVANSSALSLILLRVSDGKYLDTSGAFSSSSEIAFVTITDTTYSTGSVGIWLNDDNSKPFVISSFSYSTAIIATALNIGTLTQGTISLGSINISALASSGGTSPYTYQWYRSNTSGFTPSSSNLLTGQTNLNLADTTAIADTLYFYKLITTDSAGNTVISAQVAGYSLSSQLKIGFIGDSITAAYSCVTKTQLRLAEVVNLRNVLVYNAGVSGSRTDNWLPSGTDLTNALQNFNTNLGTPSTSNPVWISIMLGVNDVRVSPPGNSPATYLSHMTTIVNYLVSLGYKIILNAPPYVQIPQVSTGVGNNGYDTEAGMANLLQYPVQLDTLCDGVNVFKGDRIATKYMATHLGEFVTTDIGSNNLPTLVHPNPLGEDSYAALWTNAILNAVYPTSTTTIRTSKSFGSFADYVF